MITLAVTLGVVSLLGSVLALVLAIGGSVQIARLEEEHEDTIDSVGDLFEDHEARISGLEFDTPIYVPAHGTVTCVGMQHDDREIVSYGGITNE